MMTIADIYDALTAMDRPYKKAMPANRALDILGYEAKAGKIDSELLDVFIEARVYEKSPNRRSTDAKENYCDAFIIILTLGLSACEQRPKQQFMEWVVRDAWDPVCSKDAAVERFVVKNAGWENQNNRIWRMDVDATFKTIKDCMAPKPKLSGEAANNEELAKALKPTVRKAAFKSFTFQKRGFGLVCCSDAAGKEGWGQPQNAPEVLDRPTAFRRDCRCDARAPGKKCFGQTEVTFSVFVAS